MPDDETRELSAEEMGELKRFALSNPKYTHILMWDEPHDWQFKGAQSWCQAADLRGGLPQEAKHVRIIGTTQFWGD